MKHWRIAAISVLVLLFFSSSMEAQTPLATVPIGLPARAVAFNAVTNKIYVVGGLGNTLTEIDGYTFQSITIPLQATTDNASANIVVNPVTNKIYVINVVSNNVAVVDGVT